MGFHVVDEVAERYKFQCNLVLRHYYSRPRVTHAK